jgi:Cu/Ag efflux protein CusF
MDAMTMEFPVKPKPEFDKLSPGDQVTGAVVVRGMDYHVTDIKVVAKKTETPQ